MKETAKINFYIHENYCAEDAGKRWIAEIESIDLLKNESFWKCYYAETKKKVTAKAKAYETKFFKKANKA